MTSKQALARLAAPTGRSRRRPERAGEGDPCPLDPKHGAMFVSRATPGQAATQRCVHQTHDLTDDRVTWPGDLGFPEAVAEWQRGLDVSVNGSGKL